MSDVQYDQVIKHGKPGHKNVMDGGSLMGYEDRKITGLFKLTITRKIYGQKKTINPKVKVSRPF